MGIKIIPDAEDKELEEINPQSPSQSRALPCLHLMFAFLLHQSNLDWVLIARCLKCWSQF